MAAPALAASMADCAICCGVTGTAGFFPGVCYYRKRESGGAPPLTYSIWATGDGKGWHLAADPTTGAVLKFDSDQARDDAWEKYVVENENALEG